MNQILIIQTAFLGDVILATPVVSELKRLFPESRIDIMVKKGNESLLANNPKLNEVLTFDKSAGKYKSMRKHIKSFRATKYDLVLNLHRFASSGLMAGLSKGKLKYGFKKNPFSFLYTKKFDHTIGDGTHEVERNLSIIQEFGSDKLVRPEMYPSSSDYDAVKKYQQDPYICMAPASVWYTKQLPIEKWNELIEKNKTKNVFLLGGPTDQELCSAIVKNHPETKILSLAGKVTLLQSAALMKNAEHNYVNDSGPLHIASAMNADVTAFFCSTVPSFGFGPLSENSTIKEVKNLDCRPCGLHGHKECPKGHFDCGKKISI